MVLVNVAFVLTVRVAIRVAAVIVTVFVLDPSPIVMFGAVPVGVRAPKLAAPVKRMVPGPFTPLVVVPLFVKVPDTVIVWPLLIINLLVAALIVRLVIEAAAVTVTVFPVAIVTLSVARGTVPPGQGALLVLEFQLPLPAVVIFAAIAVAPNTTMRTNIVSRTIK